MSEWTDKQQAALETALARAARADRLALEKHDLKQEAKRLRAGLRRYADHDHDCNMAKPECSCGFYALFTEDDPR